MSAVWKSVALVVIGAVAFLLLDTEENKRRFRRWRRVANRWARRALDELRGAGRSSVEEARDLYSMVDLTAAFAAGMDTSGWDALAVEQRDEVLAFLQDARVYAERLVESTRYPLAAIEVTEEEVGQHVAGRIKEILAEAGLPDVRHTRIASGDVRVTSIGPDVDGIGSFVVVTDPRVPPGAALVEGPDGALEAAILNIDLGEPDEGPSLEASLGEAPSERRARISGGGR